MCYGNLESKALKGVQRIRMKIVSFNVNGIRAAVRKGFLKWFQESKADIICLQEVRAEIEQMPSDLVNFHGYYSYFNVAMKKGYSGVAIYSRKKPQRIGYKLGMERFDQEGRMLALEYENFVLVNLYLPHGGWQKENLPYKLKVYQFFLDYLKNIVSQKPVILAGDFNIAHQEIDLARPKQNYNNTMFTPAEREQIDRIIDLGFIDTWREFDQNSGNYTWWSNFAHARQRNLGWRIDYIFTSSQFKKGLKKAFIWPEVECSDHCPIGVNIC